MMKERSLKELYVDPLQMRTKQVPVLGACFLLWSLYIASSQTVYPGIKARITQRALDYGESDVRKRNLLIVSEWSLHLVSHSS